MSSYSYVEGLSFERLLSMHKQTSNGWRQLPAFIRDPKEGDLTPADLHEAIGELIACREALSIERQRVAVADARIELQRRELAALNQRLAGARAQIRLLRDRSCGS